MKEDGEVKVAERLLELTQRMKKAILEDDGEGLEILLRERHDLIRRVQRLDDPKARIMVEEVVRLDREMRTLIASYMEDIRRELRSLSRRRRLLETYRNQSIP